MRGRAVVCALLLGLGSAVRAESALADEAPGSARPTVLLLSDRQADAFVARVQAELSALGFAVVVVREAESPQSVPLETQARDAGAVAAIRVTRGSGGAEVWVADRVTGKIVQRKVVADDAATIAIRAVELLRASLLEVRSPHPSRGEVEASPVVRAIVDAEQPTPRASPPSPATVPEVAPTVRELPERPASPPVLSTPPRTFGFGVGPALMWSAGGLLVMPMLDVSGYAAIPKGRLARA